MYENSANSLTHVHLTTTAFVSFPGKGAPKMYAGGKTTRTETRRARR